MQDSTTPVPGFSDLGLPTFLVNNLVKQGYTEPTAIQAGTIPTLLTGPWTWWVSRKPVPAKQQRLRFRSLQTSI